LVAVIEDRVSAKYPEMELRGLFWRITIARRAIHLGNAADVEASVLVRRGLDGYVRVWRAMIHPHELDIDGLHRDIGHGVPCPLFYDSPHVTPRPELSTATTSPPRVAPHPPRRESVRAHSQIELFSC